jgi:hypothetical protein
MPKSGKTIGRCRFVSMSDTLGVIDLILRERRSLETALGELVAKYNRASCKSPELARMIRQLKAEIAQRKRAQGSRRN